MTGESNTGRGERSEPARRAQPTNGGLRQFLESARAQQQQQRREAEHAQQLQSAQEPQQTQEPQQPLGDHRHPQPQDSPARPGLNAGNARNAERPGTTPTGQPSTAYHPQQPDPAPAFGRATSPLDRATLRIPMPANPPGSSQETPQSAPEPRQADADEPHPGHVDEPRPEHARGPHHGHTPEPPPEHLTQRLPVQPNPARPHPEQVRPTDAQEPLTRRLPIPPTAGAPTAPQADDAGATDALPVEQPHRGGEFTSSSTAHRSNGPARPGPGVVTPNGAVRPGSAGETPNSGGRRGPTADALNRPGRPGSRSGAGHPSPAFDAPAGAEHPDPAGDSPTEVMSAVPPTAGREGNPQSTLRFVSASPANPESGSTGDEQGAPRPPAPRAPGERRPISRQSAETTKRPEFLQIMRSPKARTIGIAVGALFGLGLLGYVADLAMSSGEVPRGVVVAGVEIGGMDESAADARLRAELDGRASRELPVTIGDVQTTLVPASAGLSVDWDGTWDRIGGQPLNPITRLTSLFGTETVEVDTAVDEQALGKTFDALRVHDRPTVEGTIVFENARPVAVAPVPGRVLDAAAARDVLVRNWVTGTPMNLPVVPAPVAVRQDAIDQALQQVAQPAVAAPVIFDGKGGKAQLAPEQIATIVSFAPDGNGGLTPRIDQKVATDLLAPQLKESEVEPKDATFTLTGGKPMVVPSVVGDKINWQKTLEPLATLLAAPAPQRTAPAVYEKVEPKLTTEAAAGLGIVEPMGEFTTGGFSGPSGVNIRTVARKVNGAVVKPGETFSLNEFTGPRGIAEGYVESGIIDHGRPSKAVGGGISQFATTLYNAAYFAGLEDTGHTEHSYYISRYPAAREATVFDGAIDLSFRNNTANGIYIEASANNSEVTVRIWGTKTVQVESITGERTKPTKPKTITLPKGEGCIATEGADGFTVSDTRVITDIATGREVSRTTRTVKYDPIPIVKCE